jgi:hypothetical protein
MSESVDLVCLHEGAHAVLAAGLSDGAFQLVSATARQGDSRVRTRWRSVDAAQDAKTHEKLALIDLAGRAAELRHLRQAAWATDEASAAANAERVVLLRHGCPGAEPSDAMKGEAAALLARLREQAEVLVEVNWPAIQRVAAALAGGGTMSAAEVDALLEP